MLIDFILWSRTELLELKATVIELQDLLNKTRLWYTSHEKFYFIEFIIRPLEVSK